MKRTISIRRGLCTAALLLPLLMVWGCGKHAEVSSKAGLIGKWEGTLDASSVDRIPGKTMRIVMNIRKEGDHFTASMATPDEGPQVVPADSVEFNNDTLTMKVSKRLALIAAKINRDGTELHGTFHQKPYNLPLALKKAKSL